MDEVLFQITKEQLETGLRGFPVGYCNTSFVDPIKGLFYRERPISELANWEVERVIYLLYYGKEGGAAEIASFSQELRKRGHISQAVSKHIEGLPKSGHPMKLFCAALLILGMLEGKGDYREDSINLIAKLPHLCATVINYHAGWGQTPSPDEKKGYIENFTYMLKQPKKEKERLLPALRLFHILHLDHGGGNLSTFVGKAVASGLEEMYGAITSAMCALAGPKHGKANQDCLDFVRLVLEKLGENATLFQVEDLIEKRLQNKELIFGFGHAVLREEDPRATLFYNYAKEHFLEEPLVKIALLLREGGTKVLKKNPKISNPYPNVDAISGTILSVAGFPYPEYFTLLFGLSRVIGIAVQIVYERCIAREGKGTPIVRPRYIYKAE